MIDIILTAFVTLFVVIDPLGLTPMFLVITEGGDRAFRRRMAVRGVLISTGILFFFAMIGNEFMGLLGIDLSSFRIAGGFMLFLVALEMVFEKRSSRKSQKAEEVIEKENLEDISVFPLAIPLLAGPGAITTVMLLMSAQEGNPTGQGVTLAVLGGVLLICLIMFFLAESMARYLSETFINVLTRLLGVLLAALATQYMIDGIRTGLFSG